MSIYPLKIIASIYPRSIKQHFKIINIITSITIHISCFLNRIFNISKTISCNDLIYTCIFIISIYFNLLISFLFLFNCILPSKLITKNSFQNLQTHLLQFGKTFEHSLRFTPRQNRGSSPLRGVMKRSRLPSRGPFRTICDESGANKVREARPCKASYKAMVLSAVIKVWPTRVRKLSGRWLRRRSKSYLMYYTLPSFSTYLRNRSIRLEWSIPKPISSNVFLFENFLLDFVYRIIDEKIRVESCRTSVGSVGYDPATSRSNK